jgi:hypothetical protein
VLTQSTGDRLFLRPLTVDKLVEEIPNSWRNQNFLLAAVESNMHISGSSVNIVAVGWTTRCSIVGRDETSRLVLRPTQPPTQWVPGVQQPGCDVHSSRPSSGKVRMSGDLPLLPLCLRDSHTFGTIFLSFHLHRLQHKHSVNIFLYADISLCQICQWTVKMYLTQWTRNWYEVNTLTFRNRASYI